MRRLIVVLLGLALSAGALAFLAGTIDLAATAEILARTNPLPLVVALVVIGCQVILRSYRWHTILPPRPDGRAVPVRRLVPPLLIGYLGNAVLPARLGEPMRAVLVSRRESIGVAESLASVLLERIVDVATLALITLLAAVLVGAPAWVIQVAALASAVGVGVVALLATVGPAPLVSFARRLPLVGRSRALSSGFDQLDRFATALGGAHRRRVIGLAAFISLAAWLLDATTFWLVAQALGVDLVPAGAMLVAGVTVLGTAVPSAPGYVGTFELAASAVATALGVPGESALALAVLAHVVTLIPVALGGAVSLLVVGTGLREVARVAEDAGP